MQEEKVAIPLDTVFVTPTTCTVGQQALEIVDAIGFPIEHLRGPMPFIPPGAVLLLGYSSNHFRNRYLRILPDEPKEHRTFDTDLCRIVTDMGFLKRARKIIFINQRHADPRTSRFEGAHAENFAVAIHNFCGYQKPREKKSHRPWQELREERRQARAEGRYGKPLWALPG